MSYGLREKRTMCQFCYTLMVDFFKGLFLGLVSNIKQKVLKSNKIQGRLKLSHITVLKWDKKGSGQGGQGSIFLKPQQV